ncbi:MAG: hypothetical protein ABIZ49_03915 [Opitutaceae bacterium]
MLLRSIPGKLALLFTLGATLPTAGVAQTFVAKWDSQDNQAGKFMGPVGMAVDQVGGTTFLYVCDETGGRILKFNADTGVRVAAFGTVGTGDGEFNRPYGIAIDPVSRDLYVSERDNGRVQRITNTGAFVMKWGTPGGTGSPQGNFDQPIGIAADAAGNVYVADNRNHRVQKFRVRFAAGAWVVDNVAMWGTSGAGAGQFNRPYGLALDVGGNVWVTDGLNARVQKFSPDGVYLQTVGTRGSGDGQFIIVTGVAFDATGAMYVTSTNSDPEHASAPDIEVQRVQKFSASGAFLWRYGTFGHGDGQFQLPFNIALDAAGFGYVSDYYNIRIQKFDFRAAANRVAQTIDFQPLPDRAANEPTVVLNATASSGLPVSFSLVSGPAQLAGNTLTLTGAAGIVTVRASQGGNATFLPAAEVDRSFQAFAAAPRIYFGKMGVADVAIAIAAAAPEGIFIARPGSGEPLAIKFSLRSDGTLAGSSASILADGSGAVAAARGRTLNGRVTGNGIVGDIAELGATFSANLQPATGPAAPYAGAYTASALGSAFDDFRLIVSAAGEVRALAASNVASGWGSGTVDATGRVATQLSGGISLAGSIDDAGGIGGRMQRVGADIPIAGLSSAASRTDRLANISSRMRVVAGDGSRAFIAGFSIAGTVPKPVLLRGVGPGLLAYQVSNALPNPSIVLRADNGAIVAQNDDWGGSVAVADAANRLGGFALANGSRDAALLVTLPPGGYTAQLTAANGDGVGLIEIYDASIAASTTPRLINLSTRGVVDTGEGVLVAGFVVTGNAPRRLLIRGIGPTLVEFAVPDVLADPVLSVYAAGGEVIAQNDNWGSPRAIGVGQIPASGEEIATANSATGAFTLPNGSRDAAVVVTLAPGNYSATVSGVGNATGAAMVEVYELAAP